MKLDIVKLRDKTWKILVKLFQLAFLFIVFSHNVSALESVTLQLKYLHQFQFAGYYAAKQQGYYQQAGLDVEIVEGLSGNEPLQEVMSNGAEYGVGSSSVLLAHSAGNSVVVLAVVFQHSPLALVVPEKYGYNIQQIAGKRVMIAAQAEDLIAYLKAEGLDLSELQELEHSFDPNDLLNDRVDAFSVYVTNETDYLDQSKFNYHIYSPRSAGIDFYGDNLFTSLAEIQNHPERVKAFRDASLRGWQYALNNPAKIVDLIRSEYSQRNSRQHLLYEARQMMPLIEPLLVEVGYMSSVRWRHIADTYAHLNMLPKNYKFEGLIYSPEPQYVTSWWYAPSIILVSLLLFSSSIYIIRLGMERKKAKEDMHFNNIMLSTQQEASIDGLLAIDTKGQIISVNGRFFDLWEISSNEPKNASCIQILMNEKLKSPISITGSVDMFREQNNLLNTEELFLKDGRVMDLYWAPMLGSNKEHYGQLWSFRDITDRKESEKIIWEQANYDFLTGLPNRNMLVDRLSQEIKRAERSNQYVALLFLDLDRFKEVNDTLGHDIGDRLIQQASERLQKCVRDTDTISRLGGDEFTVILGSVSNHQLVERVTTEILEKLSQPFEFDGEVVHISTSIGVTLYPDDGNEPNSLLKNADQAMYAAKGQGRNRMHYYTPEMQERAYFRRQVANDLRIALRDEQFQLYYQPIIDLATGKTVKVEALIRWFHPLKGLINPQDFIEIAEETRMIIDIGDWVFKEACNQIIQWRKKYKVELQISINVSPVQFKNEGINQLDWFQYLSNMGLSGQELAIEITEGLLMDASNLITEKLLSFRQAGVNIAIDDFGTGYSSLSYLKRFDIDILKIDRSFVKNLKPYSDDLALCEAIIMMAHKLGLKVVAEGVETKEQQLLLTKAGCDYGQGYLFGKPMTDIEFESTICK